MKEHPILFITPMVQAILEGRKTMTRRILKPHKNAYGGIEIRGNKVINWDANGNELINECRYGQSEDLLWVRESFGYYSNTLFYKADDSLAAEKWRPSIHMPKTAARIWLQVDEIRVERLQEISEEDAIAEGITAYDDKMVSATRFTYQPGLLSNSLTAKREFVRLWCKINGEQSWKANPWVWVVKYKVLSTTGKPQICYKTNEVCKYDCKGLCRESM